MELLTLILDKFSVSECLLMAKHKDGSQSAAATAVCIQLIVLFAAFDGSVRR